MNRRDLRVRFLRTLIRSARRLAYDEVDEVLSGRRRIDPVIDELVGSLAALATVLRARRLERGALDMALPEVEFTLGEVHVDRVALAWQVLPDVKLGLQLNNLFDREYVQSAFSGQQWLMGMPRSYFATVDYTF